MGLAKTSFGLSDKRISTNPTPSMLDGGSDRTRTAVKQQQKRMWARQDQYLLYFPLCRSDFQKCHMRDTNADTNKSLCCLLPRC